MRKVILAGFFLNIFIWGISINNCLGQTNHFMFDHLTVDDGLSSNRIWCIHRDQKDFLWVSTDVGLDRYDSYDFKKYRFDEKKPGSISSDNVVCIYEDREKKLWFGTTDGLNLYDPIKDNFRVFKKDSSDTNSLNSNKINSITQDINGNIWIVTDGDCLNKWIPGTQKFIRYPYYDLKDNLYPRPSRMIASDSKGNLWVVSLGRGIYHFDSGSGKFTKYDDPDIDFGNDCYKSLFIDNQDKIWITTDGNGFFSYNPGTNKFEQYGSGGDGRGTNQKTILDIIPEGNRYLLLAVDQGGINRFDKLTKTFEYIQSDQAAGRGLNHNGIWCFHKDREGILWVGTSGGGINYYNPKKNVFKVFKHNNTSNSLSYNFAGCFFEDHEGMIWIGTDGGGVNVYDPKTEKFRVFKHNPADPFSISGNVIRCFDEDKDNDIWIGTWDAGLNRFDRKTGKFYRYMPDKKNPSSISGRSIWNLKIDDKGMLWLAEYRNGIDLLDKTKGVVKRFRNNPDNPNSISSDAIWFFYKDNENNMWICTQNGLDRYDSKTNSFKLYNFPENVLGAFWKDKDGCFWVGTTTKGMYYCNPDGTIIKTFDITNGLPNNRIQAIVGDEHENIWVSTSDGISRLDRKTGQLRNYSKEDGLQGDQFFQQSFLKTKKGEIYFGGYNGFNAFYPDSLKDNDFIPKVYVTDFQIFNKPVDYSSSGSQFQTDITVAKEITLNSDQSVFSFSFAAINYTNSAKNQYAYYMEGFDKEWNSASSARRYVTYTNLDPGEYTFHIKASNNDGKWNENGVSLKIVILPPWWKTMWFRALALFVFLLSLFLGYYFKLELYRKKQKELSLLVEQRTEEISMANKVLLERQIQIEKQSQELLVNTNNLKEKNKLLVLNQELIINQSDIINESNNELVKLNSTKDKIFSIIAHDLRNPFNVVSGFSELLLEDYKKLSPENIEMYLKQIQNSSKNGNILLENLLQWSRNQTGNFSFEPQLINLLTAVKETIYYLEGDGIKKNINIQLQIDSELNVKADEKMLKTILRNLLSNAIKFTHKNGKIGISATLDTEHVEICISDSGVGIPESKIPLLFKIETNTSTKGTSQEAGTGLGLIICSEFVEKHHGKIWVESQVGIGTQFKFTLPVS